jgi:hypothetical protein
MWFKTQLTKICKCSKYYESNDQLLIKAKSKPLEIIALDKLGKLYGSL